MIDRVLVEYLVNAVWQVPLVALAAWSLLKLTRLGPLGEHRVWLAVLLVCTLLPLRGVAPAPRPAPVSPAQTRFSPSRSLPAPDAVRTDTRAPGQATAPVVPAEPRLTTAKVHAYLRTFELSARTVRIVAWTYASLVSLAMLRLVFSWLSAHRMRLKSTAYAVEAAEMACWKELAAGLGVSLPTVRWSSEVTSPVVLGALSPVLMLPFDFWRCSQAEQRAAISHELAHVARRDCFVHACCQVVSLPLAWHPVIHGISQRISRTREMVCDQIAARAMRSEVVYARCLLGLAARMLGAGGDRFVAQGMGLFRSSKLEERVMKLTEVKQGMGVREMWLRRMGSVAAMGLVVGAVASFHLAPVLAEQTQAEAAPGGMAQEAVPPAVPQPPAMGTLPPMPSIGAQPVAPVEPVAPVGPVAPVAPVEPVAPVAPVAPALPETTSQGHASACSREHGVALSAAQKRQIETETRRALDQARRTLARTHNDLQKQGNTQFNSAEFDGAEFDGAEFKAQMERMKKDLAEHAADMARAQAEMAKAMAEVNSPEFKAEMGKFNTPEFQQRLQAQMKSSRESIDREMARVNSPEFQKQMTDAAQHAITPQMQKQIAEAAKQVEAAMKRLDEAQAKSHP